MTSQVSLHVPDQGNLPITAQSPPVPTGKTPAVSVMHVYLHHRVATVGKDSIRRGCGRAPSYSNASEVKWDSETVNTSGVNFVLLLLLSISTVVHWTSHHNQVIPGGHQHAHGIARVEHSWSLGICTLPRATSMRWHGRKGGYDRKGQFHMGC